MKHKQTANRKLSLDWSLHYSCNYRCPYCFFHGRWEELGKLNKYLKVEEWIRIWDIVYENCGSVHITIGGGEPIIYPNFIDLIKKLSMKHKVEFSTNLSWNVEIVKEFTEEVNPAQVFLTLSFHPHFAKFNEFLDKVLLFKQKGFSHCEGAEIEVVSVAWPPLLDSLSIFKKKFEENDVAFRVQPFIGNYKDFSYPDGYTDEQRITIKNLISDVLSEGGEQLVSYQLKEKSTKGKLCRAGQLYAHITCDGEVYRCSREREHSLGNFIKGNFRFLDKPLACEFESCPCEFRFLVENEKNRQ